MPLPGAVSKIYICSGQSVLTRTIFPFISSSLSICCNTTIRFLVSCILSMGFYIGHNFRFRFLLPIKVFQPNRIHAHICIQSRQNPAVLRSWDATQSLHIHEKSIATLLRLFLTCANQYLTHFVIHNTYQSSPINCPYYETLFV